MKKWKIISVQLLIAIVLLSACTSTKKEALKPEPTIGFEYIGKVVQKEGMHVWGSSPVIGKDGKVHLFVAEWPKNESEGFSGWFKHCSIAHYVGDSPEGPFEFVRIAVKDRDGEFNSPHNPTIKIIDGKYVLCFIVNENNDLSKQRIIMYVADDLNDEWRPAKGAEADGTMLRNPSDTSIWNYKPLLGVSNPSLIKYNKQYLLYYKSVLPHSQVTKRNRGKDYGYGVAISKNLEGPYKFYPDRITDSDIQLEDAYAFNLGNEVCLISRDFLGAKGSHCGGLLWRSGNGMHFPEERTCQSYKGLSSYLNPADLGNTNAFRGPKEGCLERPQLLTEDGKPTYMYVATGINTSPGFGSASHVFKITE